MISCVNMPLLSKCFIYQATDLNPDEYLNRDLKSNLNNKPLGRAKGKIEEHAKAYMDDVSRNPGHIAKLFHAESVLYAS